MCMCFVVVVFSWKRFTTPSETLPPPKMSARTLSFFYCVKAHETIWNPTPTKNVNPYFVVFFTAIRLTMPSGTLPPPKMCTCTLLLFLLPWKRLTTPSETLPPPKMWTCILSFFFYCEKGSRHHLEPYSQQKCAHVINLFFFYCEKAYGTIWNPNPTKKAHSSFSKFPHLT